jgi:cysteinyl-tRNA synthetase
MELGAGIASVSEGGSALDFDQAEKTPFWEGIEPSQSAFDNALGRGDIADATNALLELEEQLRTWSTETFGTDEFDDARETLRRMIVQLSQASSNTHPPEKVVAGLVEVLLAVRDRARRHQRWDEADLIRDALLDNGIDVQDGSAETTYRLRAE